MHYANPSVSDAWHLAFCQCLAELISDLDAIALDSPAAAAPVRSMIDALNGRILVHARQVTGDPAALPDVLRILTQTGVLNLTMAPDGSLTTCPAASDEPALRPEVIEPLRSPSDPFFPRQPFQVTDLATLPHPRAWVPIRDRHHAALAYDRDVLASVCEDVHEHIACLPAPAAAAALRFHVAFLKQSSLHLEQALADDDFMDWSRRVSTPDSFDEIPKCLADSCATSYGFRVMAIGMVTACYSRLVEAAVTATGEALIETVRSVFSMLDRALAACDREIDTLTSNLLGRHAKADRFIATAPRPPGPPVVVFNPSQAPLEPLTN